MEPRELGLTQQTMEYMAHLVEERDDIVMSHQSRLSRSGLCKVCDHSSQWIATAAVRFVVASEETPHRGV